MWTQWATCSPLDWGIRDGGHTKGKNKVLFLPSSSLSHKRTLRADPGGKEGKLFIPQALTLAPMVATGAPFVLCPRHSGAALLWKVQSQDAGTCQLPRGTRFPLCIEIPICLELSFPSESKRSVKAWDKAQTKPGSQELLIKLETKWAFQSCAAVAVGMAPSLAGRAWPFGLQTLPPFWRCVVGLNPRLDCFRVGLGRIDKKKGSLWITNLVPPAFPAPVIGSLDLER